jgi:hypothetical protein
MAYTPDEFARHLVEAAPKAAREAAKVVRKGSLNVKNEARRNVRATAPVHHAHAAETITYDVDTADLTITGVIGYDKEIGASAGKKGPGAIGNLLEFGGGGDHSPPHRDLARALESEEPRFVQALADAAEKALE